MKKRFKAVNINVPSGQSSGLFTIDLEKGINKKIALLTNSNSNQNINISIKDDFGNDIHPFVNYKEFLPTNGGHEESRKELIFTAGNRVNIEVSCDENLTDDFKGQFLFYLDSDY